MLRKLIIFAITSGLAAKAYKAYAQKREAGNATAAVPATTPATRGSARAV